MLIIILKFYLALVEQLDEADSQIAERFDEEINNVDSQIVERIVEVDNNVNAKIIKQNESDSKNVDRNLPNLQNVDRIKSNAKRIVEGYDAEVGNWPWQVYVMGGYSSCGGVLLNLRYVLTARHCTYNSIYHIRVVLGEYDRFKRDGSEQYRRVLRKFQHPRVDAALLLLHRPVVVNKYVKPIEMASFLPAPGIEAVVTGWGRLYSGRFSPTASVLQQVKVPVANWTSCGHQMNPIFRAFYKMPLQPNEFCAGDPLGKYANACNGDSGGPLVYQESGTSWKVIGIVSRGAPRCPSNIDYAVYVSVPSIRNWILDYIEY